MCSQPALLLLREVLLTKFYCIASKLMEYRGFWIVEDRFNTKIIIIVHENLVGLMRILNYWGVSYHCIITTIKLWQKEELASWPCGHYTDTWYTTNHLFLYPSWQVKPASWGVLRLFWPCACVCIYMCTPQCLSTCCTGGTRFLDTEKKCLLHVPMSWLALPKQSQDIVFL